ncbi:MAG: hypothetical protein H6837_18140 [Planctomycetes bacterium]|nr:hypothetical protein [Planctomycetota bacterium]
MTQVLQSTRSTATAEHTRVTLGKVVVPPRTDPYWLDLLQRVGVAAVEPTAAPGSVRVAFVPPEHGESSVEPLRRAGMVVVRGSATTPGTPRLRTVHGTGPLFDGCTAIAMPVAAVDRPVDIPPPLGRGSELLLPLPSANAARRAPAVLRAFPISPDHVVEEIVSGTDHGGLRRLVQNALRQAHHALGLPFARNACIPLGFAGGLALRIDADDFDAPATNALCTALERTDLRATWFLDVERHARKGGAPLVRALATSHHEVQSHFFHHYTYRSRRRNHTNLERAAALLLQWGVRADAAAAPFGTFHRGVAAALHDGGTRWSSEFSAVYDDHPTRLTGSDQVPVHPVCPVLLARAGVPEATILDYFAGRLGQALAAGECAVLYGHPIGDLLRVPLLDRLRAELDAHATAAGAPVWQPTLSELHAFHVRRRDTEPQCELVGEFAVGNADRRVPLVLETTTGARLTLGGACTVGHPMNATPQIASSSWRTSSPPRRWQRWRRQREIVLRRLLREVRGR